MKLRRRPGFLPALSRTCHTISTCWLDLPVVPFRAIRHFHAPIHSKIDGLLFRRDLVILIGKDVMKMREKGDIAVPRAPAHQGTGFSRRGA